ncbi:MAG: ATP-binding cassette domain-containing protein [Pseudomonadota bacterium]
MRQESEDNLQSEAPLRLNAVSKRFVNDWVLEDISISFRANVTTALVGESGCGKSTLLKLCNGLHRPDRGSVSLFSTPIDYDSLPRLRQRIGYAVQGNGLFPHLTAGDNITIAANLAGWERATIQARVQELLLLVQLDPGLLDRYPHELSGGQQQRVGLSRALMLRPSLLLLDEPFAAIDPLTRLEIHEQLISALRSEPATVLLVTHDMREALKLSDEIVFMKDGAVHGQYATEQLLAEYAGREPELLLRHVLADSGQ